MAVTWTEDQKKVIELQNRNILVSAAAGSGNAAGADTVCRRTRECGCEYYDGRALIR